MAVATPPSGVSNGELIRWAFAARNDHDAAAMSAAQSDTIVERFPKVTRHGHDEVASYFRTLLDAVPHVRLEIQALVEQGDGVFARWHLTGTHTGAPFQGIVPSGRSVAIDGVDHFVGREGRNVSNFVVCDQMHFARQIGLPADGTPADGAAKTAFNARTRLRNRRRR